MNYEAADRYLFMNSGRLPMETLPFLRDKLGALDEGRFRAAAVTPLKDPSLALVLSVFLGVFGIDRFYAGDILFGLIKLIFAGGFGILWFVDLFFIRKRIREKNFSNLAFAAA